MDAIEEMIEHHRAGKIDLSVQTIPEISAILHGEGKRASKHSISGARSALKIVFARNPAPWKGDPCEQNKLLAGWGRA